MSEETGFTPEEWQTLQFAPFWIFSGLVGAYRNFDPLEYDVFSRSLEDAAAAPGQLAHEVIRSVLQDRGRLAEQFQADDRTIARGLCAVATLLNRIPPSEADLFKEMLISGVGMSMAKARGRFGRIMSEDDEKTLTLIAQFLS
jgi:hypothetical protein